jgi:hypothetical protein
MMLLAFPGRNVGALNQRHHHVLVVVAGLVDAVAFPPVSFVCLDSLTSAAHWLHAEDAHGFPTEVRGMAAGFAAAFAKMGAVATAFLFPILLDAIGTRALLYGLIVTSLLGAVVTWMYRIETTGVNLD